MVRKEYVVEEVVKLMANEENVRNIAIVAHVDHGKTTLTDSLVARAGLISKDLAGSQRVMDFDEQEQARGITIKAAYISLGFNYEGKDYLINLIDTPGHVDFSGHVTRAMRAVDGVILVVDSVEGVMPQTETVIRQALKERAKPVLFVNKIDRLINELKLDQQAMQERLLKIIINVNKLIDKYGPPEMKDEWKIDVNKGNVAFGSAFHKWALNVPHMKKTGLTFKDLYETCRNQTHKELMEKASVDEVLLGMTIRHHPSPKVAQKYRVPIIWKGDVSTPIGQSMLSCDPSGKVVAVVFGVAVDEHAGEVAIARVFSGTVRKGVELWISSKMRREKCQMVGIYMGPDRVPVESVLAGNIVAIVGLKDVIVGDTIAEEEMYPFEQIKHYSEPVITKSIEAKNAKDLVKLINALRQISKEDQTLRVEINQDTGEHLISGMGELHLEIIEYKIVKERGIEITTSPPIVLYRETITGSAGPIEGKSPNKHTKFYVSVEPLKPEVMKAMEEGKIPEGRPKGKQLVETLVAAGMERDIAKNVRDIYNKNVFVDMTKGVQYLNEVMELLIEGFEQAMSDGPLAREKVTGVMVKLVDALIHEDPVHRGPAQILPAIKRPIYAGMLMAGITLLEPKRKLFVQCPTDYMSDVISLIQGRRAQDLEISQEEETVTISAKVPVAEMFGFANAIRGTTQGRAIWYDEFAGFESLPKDLVPPIVKKIRERKGEKPEPPTANDFLG